MIIKNFEQWALESEKFNMSMNSIEATRLLGENLLAKTGFSDEERLCLYVLKESNASLFEWESLNEGFLEKLKELGKKAVDTGNEFYKDVKTVVGKELSGIPEFFTALSKGLKNLGEYILNVLTKIVSFMFSKPVEWMKKALGGNYAKFEKEIKSTAERKPNKLKQESEGFVPIVKSSHTLLSPQNIADKLKGVFQKTDSQEKIKRSELEVVEEALKTSILLSIAEAVKRHTINEIQEGFEAFCEEEQLSENDHGHTKIPFISTISSILEKMPPFSWLSLLAQFIAENTNEALTHLSKKLNEKGYTKEAVEFLVIGTLVGLGLEFFIKTQAKSALGYFFPPLHSVLVILGTIATGICIVHISSTVIDGLTDIEKEITGHSQKFTH